MPATPAQASARGRQTRASRAQRAASPLRAESAALKTLPYPDLPELGGDRALFWRAGWLRDHAELQALKLLTKRQAFDRESAPLQFAIYGAINAAEKELASSFTNLVNAGGLLYAWIPSARSAAS